MKRVVVLFFTLLLSNNAFAQEHVVISNKTMKALSPSQIKAIFLKKMSIIGDVQVVPVSLQVQDPLRKSFEKHILKMSFTRLKSYWTAQHYLGVRPPLSMRSQESVKSFVKKVDGSIAYIDIENLDSDLKVLYSWED